jgi:hypothetical protein
MKKAKPDKEIKKNIRWFLKFPLEKRLTLAFEQMRAIKILRNLLPKKHGAAN